MKPLSLFQQHVEKWKNCTNCELHLCRSKVVFFRGSIPCEVLFIGEAPGFNENSIGQPFVGPAGQHLDKIITRALAPDGTLTRSCGFTNLVCCIPKDADNNKVSEPDHDNVLACQERLAEMVDMCRPKLVVRLGKPAQEYLDRSYRHALKVPSCVMMTNLVHPAFILRSNFANRELLTQRCIVMLASAAEKIDELPDWEPEDRCSVYSRAEKPRKGLFRTLEQEGTSNGDDVPPWDSENVPF